MTDVNNVKEMFNSNNWIPKLYVVTRKDLSPGAQACQSIHAVCEFNHKHPNEYQEWFTKSNHLALLSVKNEKILNQYVRLAEKFGIHYAIFREPDFDNELTAVAFEATTKARDLLGDVKSALKLNWLKQPK